MRSNFYNGACVSKSSGAPVTAARSNEPRKPAVPNEERRGRKVKMKRGRPHKIQRVPFDEFSVGPHLVNAFKVVVEVKNKRRQHPRPVDINVCSAFIEDAIREKVAREV
jgi:hypothetical protein